MWRGHVSWIMVAAILLGPTVLPGTHVTGDDPGTWGALDEPPQFTWVSAVYLFAAGLVTLVVLAIIVSSTVTRRRAAPRDPVVKE